MAINVKTLPKLSDFGKNEWLRRRNNKMDSRLFAQTFDSKYRYKMDLEIRVAELKGKMSYKISIGYGMPNIGKKNEFYFTHCQSSKIDGASISDAMIVFEDIESIITEELKANLFRVAELNINLTYENLPPLMIKKVDITANDAKQTFESAKSQAISEIQKYIPSYKCGIL